MANIRSLLKIFKKNKKNETNCEVMPKPQQINRSSFKVKHKSIFQSKTPQKLNEKISDMKTSKSLRKQSFEGKEREIELVGNYLINEDNQTPQLLPVRPQRKHSKTRIKAITTSETHNQKDPRKIPLILSPNKINTTLDSIIEMNSNPIIKTDDKLQKTDNQLERNPAKIQQKPEDLAGVAPTKIPSKDISSKLNFELVDTESNALNTSQNSLHIKCNKSKTNVEMGLVSVRDIDLKTAKCFICLRLVSKNINITVCSHIFCMECLRQWLRYSQHCPQCRTFISSFGHSIRTRFDRICIRSEEDYRVTRVSKNEDNFIESLGAAYLFEAFLSNQDVSKYLDSTIANICAKISDLESKLSTNGSVQRNVNIRYRITEENQKLEEFKGKRSQSEERFKDICEETKPGMLTFWNKALALRLNSKLTTLLV